LYQTDSQTREADRETDRQAEVLLTVTSEAIEDPDTRVSNITDAVRLKHCPLYGRVVALYYLTVVIAVQCLAQVIQVCNRHTHTHSHEHRATQTYA